MIFLRNRVFIAVLWVFALFLGGCGDDAAPTDTLKVMTFNIMCVFCGQGYDPWENRITYMADIFNRHQPDIVGTQEFFQSEDLNEVLALVPRYGALYYIDDGEGFLPDYPDAAIFYLTERFEVLEQGYYWLGDTPDEAWTGGWADSQFWRIVAWARFRQKDNGREFVVVNTHFDNNFPNQQNSAPLLLNRTAPWAATLPVIVTGDFNSKPDSIAYGILVNGQEQGGFALSNSFDIAKAWRVDHNQAEAPVYDPDHRIDHIFYAGPGAWSCSDWVADLWTYGEENRYPSDHFALMATLTF